MKITEQPISFSGEKLILTSQRAIFWERKSALILSDLHLGKAAHFRKSGIALPTQITLQDLNRLELLIHHYNAEQVIIVGDLIHAGANKELRLFTHLTQQFAHTSFVLIKGNHDRFSERGITALGIKTVYHSLYSAPISFIHHYQKEDLNTRHETTDTIHPSPAAELINKAGTADGTHLRQIKGAAFICGHLHPGVSLTLPSKRRMRFPCYVVTERRIILPAFSRFTGLDTSSLPPRAVCYALHEEEIFKIEP